MDHENFSINNYAVGTNMTDVTMVDPFYTQAMKDYSLDYSTQKVKTGTRSARIELRPYDKNTTGKTTSGRTSNETTVIRSEIVLTASTVTEREVWYSVAMFIPKTTTVINGDTIPGYVSDSNWEILTQWHSWDDTHLGETARTPPLSLSITNGTMNFRKNWSVEPVNTNVTTNVPGKQGYKIFNLGPASAKTGIWLNWVYHFVFDYSPNGKGQMQVWLNGINVLDDYGPNNYNDVKKYPYFKAGIYKRNFDATTPKRVLYIDEIYHADSLATYNDVRTDQ